MPNELLADVLKHVGKAKCTSYNLTTGANASVKLQTYIEKRNYSCAHLQMFFCVVPSEGNEHIMAARNDFVDELSQLKSSQMRRNIKIKAGINLFLKNVFDRFLKARTARICKPSWKFWR